MTENPHHYPKGTDTPPGESILGEFTDLLVSIPLDVLRNIFEKILNAGEGNKEEPVKWLTQAQVDEIKKQAGVNLEDNS